MHPFIINGTLAPRHREAGLELVEDDHIVELRHNGGSVAQFSATGTTVLEIHKAADKWLEEQHVKRWKQHG
jgi:hypothetical protein